MLNFSLQLSDVNYLIKSIRVAFGGSRTVSGSHGRFLSLSRYSLVSFGSRYVLDLRNLIGVALISHDT